MNNNNSSKLSFVNSFNNVSKNLAIRYSINMHLDFIQEFIKFADNTRDIDLQNDILEQIQTCEHYIINLIQNYEDSNKENSNISDD